MHTDITQLVTKLHGLPGRLVLVTAGAGTNALSWLLGVPGASRTVMESLVPYGMPAFDDFLGRKPQKYVAQKTARYMAGRALTRAKILAEDGEPVIGVACTATIITDRPKKGDHRAHIAVWTNNRVISYHLTLHKGKRTRQQEEDAVSRVIINAIAEAYGLEERLRIDLFPEDDLQTEPDELNTAIQQLYQKEHPFIGIYDHGQIKTQNIKPEVVLPGSFNPLHDGHLKLAHTASQYLNKPIAFELSAFNVDKDPIDSADALSRAAQFAGRWPIYITNAPTFIQKARLFPGTTFVVGYDTAARILMPRYYNDSPSQMLKAIAEMIDLNCQFLVANRLDKDGRFKKATQLPIPIGCENLFIPLPNFRHDISSSELRQKGLKGSR